MRKLFILSWLAMMIVWGIGGCGGGGTSADPLGTDGLMFGYKVDAAGTDWSTAMDVTPRGTVILTAKIKNASDKPVIGREVTFVFVSNASGATLSSTKASTDSTGEAMTLYTAGMVAGFDVVRASISNGATLDTNITVASPGAGGLQIALDGSETSLAAGRNSILTATVTDGSGNPVSGAIVKFSFILNWSSANLDDLNFGLGALTDGAGKAVAVYTAGSATPTQIVEDTIQARVAGATTGALVMTRTATGGGGGAGVRITVTAVPQSLTVGPLSVITAQVNNADGTPAAGLLVSFSIVTSNSGLPVLYPETATTNASGTAIATYTAGSALPSVTVQDAVSASVSGSADVVILTRLTATGTGNRILSFTETPETTALSPLTTTAGNCLLTVLVTMGDLITPVVNERVTFSIVTGTGTISAATAMTDTQGKAWVLFTGPGGVGPGETVVRATISGTTNGGDAARIIYW
jgi:hypothetical protein